MPKAVAKKQGRKLKSRTRSSKSKKKSSRKKNISENSDKVKTIRESRSSTRSDSKQSTNNVSDEKETETSSKAKRRTLSRESVIEDFDSLINQIESEISKLRQGPAKTKGVKFLRSTNKNLKLLKNRASRVMKQKKKSGRTNNKNSGFLKPVAISAEMAKFTGWEPSELKSRVQVTKYICEYIKDHNLQNPEDRRQIRPDSKLRKLLDFDPRKNKEPLRYYSLQTHLKRHFPKTP